MRTHGVWTRYIGPTDHKPSRIRVTWGRDSLVVPYDHGASGESHRAAVRDAMERWGQTVVPAGVWVALEATSMFGDEYGGPLDDAPDGTYTVVGPDPHRDRKWYATITKRDGKITVK